jgi:hypothetical protein
MMALGNIVECYMDDLIIHSNDEDHADILAWVLKKLWQCNIQVEPKKAFIARPSVHFLGHIMDKDGLHVNPEKTRALSAMPPPTDAAGVKRFLGMAGYYRRFVPNFGQRTASMTDLLQKTVAFDWTPTCQAEFEDVRDALSNAPVLALPRWDLPFIIRTDASKTGMGCLLCQIIDGVRRIIACVSRKWTVHERNWDVRRQEIFCSLYGCRKFAPYMFKAPTSSLKRTTATCCGSRRWSTPRRSCTAGPFSSAVSTSL